MRESVIRARTVYLVIAVFAALIQASCDGAGLSEEEQKIFEEINEYRMSLGLNPVEHDPCLSAASYEQAVGLQAMQAYKPGLPRDHSGMDQSDMGERAAGHGCYAGGEISAMGPDPVDSWKNSPGHNDIMIDGSFSRIGIAQVGSITIAMFGD